MAKSALTTDQHELLAMLASELQAQLEVSLNDIEKSASVDSLNEQAESLGNFAHAAELIGLDGLALAWNCLRENFSLLAQQEAISGDEKFLVDSWILYCLDFLNQLDDGQVTAESIAPLIEFLASPEWPSPLSSDQKVLIADQLLQAELSADDDSSYRLPIFATPEMLSLALGEDINPDLFEGLMIELPTQVHQFTDQLNQFVEQHNKDSLASAQRIAHTLKGAANVVGVTGLANFMHFSEDFLEEIAKHNEPLTPALKTLLVDMTDTLAAMLDCLLSGDSTHDWMSGIELGVMQNVLDAYYAIRSGGLAAFDNSSANNIILGDPVEIKSSHVQAADVPVASVGETDADESHRAAMQHVPNVQETLATNLRIKEETAQDLLRLAGESAISTNRLQTQVQDVKHQVQHISSLHNKLTQLTEEFGQLIEVRELFNSRSKNMSDDDLDPLELDKYNELHSFFHQLQEFAIDTRDAIYQTQGQLRNLENLTYEQQVTNRASQHHLLEMRMIPANQFEARFQRCVRQACRLTGKQARFQLRGGDTMIDSRVLHELVDPLMHLLRNAVDHGVEFSDVREAVGKSPEGLIELQFLVQAQSILVRVTDDGAGLQNERIAKKAAELSIQPPQDASAEVTELWLKQLIFAAGFSTRDHVSQTSGRGIGLDMVADRVNQLKGRITVDSRPQFGCEFSIRLPMPMITEQGLLIATGKHNLAISSRGVEQLLFLEVSALTNRGDQLRYKFDQQEIDVFHIAQLARLPDVLSISAVDAHALLVVETLPGQRVGVLVERVLASREMVVKPLTPYTPYVSGVIGATILGDGQVAPVIDIQHLVLESLQSGVNAMDWVADAMLVNQKTAVTKPMALIVDDSLSTRRSLAQFVGDMGMEVRTAKDGFEAIEVLQTQVPHIILVDMEMPRMNGLELTAHVRANEDTKHVPVIMITSRNTEKHRNLATAAGVDTYLNKPFSEEELLHHIQENMHA
ncbi:MAG: hybrid sensor histidine kinase/response regulator [Gammaproteobacteria bacterium]|nr:MAG: hybrid sensor histidine kinase/response regulator [Gammaproteobacteria bacterium]